MPNKNYKSFEQQVWDELKKPATEFASSFVKSAYGTFITPFRIPTFIRKTAIGANLEQRHFGSQGSASEAGGEVFGFIAGIGALGTIVGQTISEIHHGDYSGLYFLATANICSGTYETIRGIISQRKNSKLEQQTQ